VSSIPTTSELNETIIGQLQGALGQTIPLLPKSFARVLARVLAGVFVLIFRYCGFIFLQLFVAHATMTETTVNGKKIRPLVELGRLFGVGDPYDATRAELSVTVPVLTQTGSFPAGRKFVRTETGVIYDVVSAVPLNASVVTLHLRASGDGNGTGGVGDVGNLQPNDTLALAGSDARIGSEATVVSQLLTAADAETTENYRARILQRVQRRPQGGAYADYQQWGEEVPGIVNVYPYAGVIPGTVEVYVEASVESSGSADGFPTLAQKDAVKASIEMNEEGIATRRPVNAALLVDSITRTAFALEVSGLTPDTFENREAIEASVDEYLRAREPFIVGLSSLPRNDRVTQAGVSGIVDTVVAAQGATVTTVTLVPGPAYTLGHGEKAKLGPVSYS
jgi:uncharacterized phage protein gp47/JayE